MKYRKYFPRELQIMNISSPCGKTSLSGVCKHRRSRLACTFLPYDQDFHCLFIYSTVPDNSVFRQQGPRSACPEGQADLGLCCPHLFHRPTLFSLHGTVVLVCFVVIGLLPSWELFFIFQNKILFASIDCTIFTINVGQTDRQTDRL